MKTFRQASALLFMLLPTISFAETTLYDELKFLQEASTEVEVFLPGENKTKKDPEVFEDSISTGQAGLLKKTAKSDSYKDSPKTKKRLRYRSR